MWPVLKRVNAQEELVVLKVSHVARTKNGELPRMFVARAIKYRRRGFRPQILLTSLLDVKKHPAVEVVQLYHERWEMELGYGEIKTEMLERQEAIRS